MNNVQRRYDITKANLSLLRQDLRASKRTITAYEAVVAKQSQEKVRASFCAALPRNAY